MQCHLFSAFQREKFRSTASTSSDDQNVKCGAGGAESVVVEHGPASFGCKKGMSCEMGTRNAWVQ